MGFGEGTGAEDADTDQVDEQVEGDDAGDADDEGAAEVAAGIFDFAGDEIGGLPTAVGEEDGDHGRADGGEEIERDGAVENRVQEGLRVADEKEAGADEAGDGGDFDQHEGGLQAGSGLDAEAVDGGERGQGEDDDPSVGDVEVGQFEEVLGEGDGDGRHAASLDDEKQRPSVKESGGGVPGFAQVGVLTADGGEAVGQLGVNEGSQDGDDAPGDPD